jgi:hypothetical protein
MGLARSHVRDLLGRDEDWADGRSHRTPTDDAGLLAELRQEIAQLPSYGYRRACALERLTIPCHRPTCVLRLATHGTKQEQGNQRGAV